jgi:glycine cleavage system T protein (aminomethyltransferase)
MVPQPSPKDSCTVSTAAAPAALRKTALNATHRRLGAKMVDFGGWDMPVEYSGLIAEHMAVRTGVGVFDVSHMGDIQLRGPNSLAAVQHISMNDASKLKEGQAHYSALLYPNGTFVDDVIVHKFSDNDYLLVINAGTREKDVNWVRQNVGRMQGVHVSDYSDLYTQLAIQGPRAVDVLRKLTDRDLDGIRNYWFTWGTVCGLHNTLIARTGYTGEDGRSSASSPVAWVRATPCGSNHPWPYTATRSRTRSTSLKPASIATQSSTRATSSVAMRSKPYVPGAAPNASSPVSK